MLYRGLTYRAETNELAESEMGAFFGAKLAAQARLQSAMRGGPPVHSLLLRPYFIGSTESVPRAFEVLRDCGVGVIAAHVLPVVKGWDHAACARALEPQVAMA